MKDTNPNKKDKRKSLHKKKMEEIEDMKLEILIERFKAENKALQNMLNAIEREKNEDDKE